MDIKYFVRTTGERTLDKSFSQIEYELLIDKEHKPLQSLLNQFKITNGYDAVILEDDIILCENFKNRIEEVIKKYPSQIINFFNAPTLYQDILINDNFCYSQCRYYPKGSCTIFIEEMSKRRYVCQPCIVLSRIAKQCNISILQYRPHLVQHIDNSSLFNPRMLGTGKRRSYYFIDYLDELGITYEEASTEENKQKLINLMNKKFEKYSLIKLR